MPIAASLSPGLALGCLWLGAAGGGFPDWLDLRSDIGRAARLRHRGASHGIFVVTALAVGFWYAMTAMAGVTFEVGDESVMVPTVAVTSWTLAFAAGLVSHLVSDAMTHAGISPFLPLTPWRLRLLPRPLRSRYDGYLDVALRWLSVGVLVVGVAVFIL